VRVIWCCLFFMDVLLVSVCLFILYVSMIFFHAFRGRMNLLLFRV